MRPGCTVMKAADLTEFKAALARQLIPRWNFLYTDRQNIYWVHNGNVARRNPSFDWSKPVPGWTTETEWGEYSLRRVSAGAKSVLWLSAELQ